MGLFSFLKNAGAKIFSREKTPEVEAAPSPEAGKEILRQQQLGLLHGVVNNLGIGVENLSLDLQEDTVIVYGQVESQSDREKIILTLGNVTGIAAVDDRISVSNPAPEAVFYEVQKGDTLGKIAKEHYGNAMKYPLIFEANKPMLEDPDRIYPGQMLRIPPQA